MKTVKKNVYYCDFCNKRGLSASHMIKHETHCTANPNRVCRLCEGLNISEYIDGLKKRFTIKDIETDVGDIYESITSSREVEWIGKPITLDEIIDHVDECPNCILAILRQTRLNYEVFGFKYNYIKANAKWWAEKNKEDDPYY